MKIGSIIGAAVAAVALLASGCTAVGLGGGGHQASASPSRRPSPTPPHEPALQVVTGLSQLGLRWDNSTGHLFLDDDTLLVQDDAKSLVSVDPASGKKRWSITAEHLPSNAYGFGASWREFEGRGHTYAADGMAFATFTTSRPYGKKKFDIMWTGIAGIDGKTGKVAWGWSHPWFADTTKGYKGKNPLLGREPDAEGRTKFTMVDVVGSSGGTLIYTVRDYWCFCGLTDNPPPDLDVYRATRAVDIHTGALRWERKGFLAQEVTRKTVIGSPTTGLQNRRNDYLEAVDVSNGKIAWRTHWKSAVEAVTKDWLFIEAKTSRPQDRHDGVYRADTGKRVAVFTEKNATSSGWHQEPPMPHGDGLTWAADPGFDPNNTKRELLSWVKDGDPRVHQLRLPPGKPLQIVYPLVVGSYALATYDFGPGALGDEQGWIDLRTAKLGSPLPMLSMTVEPITASDHYALVGGGSAPDILLYRMK